MYPPLDFRTRPLIGDRDMQDMKWYGSQFNSWSGNQNDAKAGSWWPLPNQLIDRGEDDLKDDEFFDDEEEDDKDDDTNHEYDDEDDLFDDEDDDDDLVDDDDDDYLDDVIDDD